MNNLDLLTRIVMHANGNHIVDGSFKRLSIHLTGAISLELPDMDVTLFAQWAESLRDWRIAGSSVVTAHLRASGLLASGDYITVSVVVDADKLRAAGLLGRVELEQLQEFARAGLVTA